MYMKMLVYVTIRVCPQTPNPLHLMCALVLGCIVTDSGQTPLDIAEEENNDECVQLVSGWLGSETVV